ncbi:unnamed protein product [Paramecium pentaurelia]|uniref:Uncharacterized protein n=1 Tax=Paramecium pentaurelia TaxID=43138 RepID=A0A8S1WXR8_9CILI|nr:unnamed protein product [Paramecium pentaurelia]
MRRLIIRFRFSEQVQVQQPKQLKRFYKEATVEMATNPTNPYHQWLVKLDGKTVKTPYKNTLAVPSPQLASFIAHEFNMQTDNIRPTTMPLLNLAKNAIDIEADDRIRQFMEQSIISYLERDTVLFRENPDTKLYKIQQEKLDPQLKIFNEKFGLYLKTNFGLNIEPLKQQDQIRIETIVSELNNWQLVSLDAKVENLKSCILALLIWNNHLEVEEAVKFSRLEEDFQTALFGKVEGHHDYDENTIMMNVSASKLFAQLIQTQSIAY